MEQKSIDDKYEDLMVQMDAISEDLNRQLTEQVRRWGLSEHPNKPELVRTGEEWAIVGGCANSATEECRDAAKAGTLSWAHILQEEHAKAMRLLSNPTVVDVDPKLRERLISVAAVALQWVACIDRRAYNAQASADYELQHGVTGGGE